jgi:hypothetical protein
MKISIQDYHSDPRISNSDLTLINKSIDHYLNKAEREVNDDFIFGQVVHDMILSPDIFDQVYIAQPEHIKRRAGKEWDYFVNQNPDKTILDQKTIVKLEAIKENFIKHPKASLLLKDGMAEESFFYEMAGIKCKCRPDFVNTKYNVLIDLKTTSAIMPDEFARSIASYRYHVQAAWYLDGINQCLEQKFEKFLFIAIDKKAPYSICIYDLGDESIEEGRRQYLKDLNKYIDYLYNKDKKEYFTGVSSEIVTLQLPTWAFYKNGDLS